MPRLTVALPASHALTRIQGEQIRDWQVKPDGERQVLTIEFIKPVEKACAVTLFSEQTVETTPLAATLVPPQPLEVERESGSFTLSADDTTVEIDGRQRAVGGRLGIQTAGRKFEYAYNLFACHVEPLHDFFNACPGFEVLENGGDGHPGIAKHPCAA